MGITQRAILFCLGIFLWSGPSFAGTIANVTVGFAGDVAQQQDVRKLIESQMQALEKSASESGVTAINLQSVSYSLSTLGIHSTDNAALQPSYQASGNLFIDIEPESKTDAFVKLLNKKGYSATINYYQRCIPSSSR